MFRAIPVGSYVKIVNGLETEVSCSHNTGIRGQNVDLQTVIVPVILRMQLFQPRAKPIIYKAVDLVAAFHTEYS